MLGERHITRVNHNFNSWNERSDNPITGTEHRPHNHPNMTLRTSFCRLKRIIEKLWITRICMGKRSAYRDYFSFICRHHRSPYGKKSYVFYSEFKKKCRWNEQTARVYSATCCHLCYSHHIIFTPVHYGYTEAKFTLPHNCRSNYSILGTRVAFYMWK